MKVDPIHTFITSDHHFGSWQLRGFLQVFSQDEDEIHIEKWNSVVKPDDVVLYNGDFSDDSVLKVNEYVKRLNGQIHLIKGNHDAYADEIYQEIFKSVNDEIHLDGLNAIVHHRPENIMDKIEIYGHLHRFVEPSINKPDSFCTCIHYSNGYPVRLDKILEIVKSQTCQVDC